jgi:hypothetical protein
VIDRDAAARGEIMAKLAQSRGEIKHLLDPPREQGADGAGGGNGHMEFPRSRTMRALMSSRGLGTIGALAGGLLIARPALALRLLRMVPASAVAKMLMVKAVAALKGNSRNGG